MITSLVKLFSYTVRRRIFLLSRNPFFYKTHSCIPFCASSIHSDHHTLSHKIKFFPTTPRSQHLRIPNQNSSWTSNFPHALRITAGIKTQDSLCSLTPRSTVLLVPFLPLALALFSAVRCRAPEHDVRSLQVRAAALTTQRLQPQLASLRAQQARLRGRPHAKHKSTKHTLPVNFLILLTHV
jgi:hypothetical protein